MNGERPLPSEDAERDAWLRAALRHAPDVHVGPPPALSERILREAHAKAPAPRAASTSARWWSWLARPSIGAAFASVMVATAVGLIWWDRPPQEHAPRPAAIAPEPDAAPAPAAPPVPVAKAPSTTATGSTQAPAPALETPVRREARRAPAPAVDATAKAAGTADVMAAAPPPPAPAAAAATVPTPAAPASPLAEAQRAPAVLSGDSRELRQRLSLSTETASLADLRATLAVDASRWSWHRGGVAEQPVGDRITGWLTQLDAETGRRWHRSPGAGPAGSGEDLVLRHQDGTSHRLGVDSGAAHWETRSPDGTLRRWQAPLGAADERALRARLQEATQ
ncbi:hypothetical protein [Piscinibacter sp. XHJ-5]|uniref:hypothetical protein n=1 Tax=Piscinibacter sp. XHJ-5 TaxID=3037797 RepID=UPI0024532A90|nr:hypothetical protein [Piscinibacter sp. XHJ-5]